MKYRLSQVQSARDDLGSLAGVGFNIVDERGAPIVTFGYLDQAKATNARALIEKAIVDVALIAPAGRMSNRPGPGVVPRSHSPIWLGSVRPQGEPSLPRDEGPRASARSARSQFDDLVQGDGNRRRVGRLGGNRRCLRLRCGRLLRGRWLDGTAAAVVTDHDGGRRTVSVQLVPVAGHGLSRCGGAKRQSS